METVKYKNYSVTKFESGTIEVAKNGHITSPTKPLLRELAQELNVNIENANGNLHITRQLGVLVMGAIKEKQSKQSTQSYETRDTSKLMDGKCYSQQPNKNISHISFMGAIRQIINTQLSHIKNH